MNKRSVVTLLEITRRSMLLGASPVISAMARIRGGSLAHLARFLRAVAPMVFLGLLLGAIIVMFPLGVAAAFLGVSVAALFWAMPDLADVPTKLLRKSFFVAVAVNVSLPSYYAVQIQGLPWISARRITMLALICLLLFVLGGSKAHRDRLTSLFKSNILLSICPLGYFIMSVFSIVFSARVGASASAFMDVILTWYLPFIACLVVIETEEDIIILFRLIVSCALLVEATGIAEFIYERRFALEALPRSLLNSLVMSNDLIADTLMRDPHRNGYYRAISIYLTPLSYGEFSSMVAPIGLFFCFHGRRTADRILGAVAFMAAIVSLFVAGSRGGFIGLILACGILSALAVIRWSRLLPHTLIGAIGSLVALAGITSVMTTILLWKRLYNIVFGGGDTVASTDARFGQWTQAKRWIFSNPVTGHGIGLGPELVDFRIPNGMASLDSYLISLIVETGVPGLLFYMGGIGLAIFFCARVYIRDLDSRGAIGGPLAGSLITYGFYRAALAQRDNQTFFFLMLGVALVFIKLAGGGEHKAATRVSRPSGFWPPITPPRERLLQRGDNGLRLPQENGPG